MAAYSDKFTIQMKDTEYCGEDPVLMAELTRRMPHVLRENATIANRTLRRRSQTARFDLEFEAVERARAAFIAKMTALNLYLEQNRTAVRSRSKTDIARQRKEDRRYKAFINQPDDNVVKKFTIQMIEQCIYSVEYRLKEIDHYINRYKRDVRFRIAYLFKELEQWLFEMDMTYQYIRNPVRSGDQKYNIWKNLYYYTHLVRKNIDVTYTIYYLLQLHTDFVEDMKKDKPPPSKNDPPSHTRSLSEMMEDMAEAGALGMSFTQPEDYYT